MMKYWLLGVSLVTSSLMAEEEEYALLGSRPACPYIQERLLQERCSEEEGASCSLFASVDHILVDVGGFHHQLLELEDGSVWEIIPGEKTDFWKVGDHLTIFPHYSWFGSGRYYLINSSTHSSIKADLICGPKSHGPYAHWVIDLDFNTGHVMLEDASTWCISSQDRDLFTQWEIGDHVIIGRYPVQTSFYTHILINVPMNSDVRAQSY